MSWVTGTWNPHTSFRTQRGGANVAIAFSPQEEVLTFNDVRTIVMLDIETGHASHKLKGHSWVIRKLDCSPDGRFLASEDSDGVRLWRLGDDTSFTHFKKEQLVGFGEDGVLLTLHGGLITRDPETPQQNSVLPIGDEVVLSADRSTIACHLDASTVHIRRVDGSAEVTRELPYSVRELTLSPRGTTVASSADEAGHIVLVAFGDPESDRVINCKPGISSFYFANDATRLVVQGSDSVELWDIASGQRIRSVYTNNIRISSVSPNGQQLVTGHRDGAIRVFELQQEPG